MAATIEPGSYKITSLIKDSTTGVVEPGPTPDETVRVDHDGVWKVEPHPTHPGYRLSIEKFRFTGVKGCRSESRVIATSAIGEGEEAAWFFVPRDSNTYTIHSNCNQALVWTAPPEGAKTQDVDVKRLVPALPKTQLFKLAKVA